MTVTVIVLAVTLALLAGAQAAIVLRRAQPAPPLTGKTVLVNTAAPDDQTVRGVVVADHSDRITLRDALYVTVHGEQPARGLVHIPRAHVSTIQEPEGE